MEARGMMCHTWLAARRVMTGGLAGHCNCSMLWMCWSEQHLARCTGSEEEIACRRKMGSDVFFLD